MLTYNLLIIVLLAGVILFLFFRACLRANLIDWGHGWYNCIDGLNRLICRHYHRLQGEPLELPASGAAIVVSNHVSGLDALVMIAASRRPLHFLIAREQYERFGLRWLFRAAGCIPVDRSGRPEKAFRDALKMLQQGHVVALFPHGRIHLDHEPPVKLKAGVVRLARLAGCPVYPFRIDGVRAQGHVVLAVFVPDRVCISARSPLQCDPGQEEADCLQQLARRLQPRA
jgi:1-acyl-sn-glycerol-3-phosphate acyltransferase